MKAKLVHEMTNDELNAKLIELKTTLFNLRFSHTVGQLTNPKELTNCKKDIARIKTVLKEREIAKAQLKA